MSMNVYFWSGLELDYNNETDPNPPVIKVTFPPQPQNRTLLEAIRTANENFYNIFALSVGVVGVVILLGMVIFFWYRNRQMERARYRHFQKCVKMAAYNEKGEDGGGADVGTVGNGVLPIYPGFVIKAEPPEYRESLIQEMQSSHTASKSVVAAGDVNGNGVNTNSRDTSSRPPPPRIIRPSWSSQQRRENLP